MMRSISLAAVAALTISACAATPVAPTTSVPQVASRADNVTAKFTVKLDGLAASRHVMVVSNAAGEDWEAGDVSEVSVTLYRNDIVDGWVSVGQTLSIAGPVTGTINLQFEHLAHNADYRVVATATGDDGANSLDDAGATVADFDGNWSGTRRIDNDFTLAASDVAAGDGNGDNYTDFSTDTSDLATVSSTLTLKLRDKVFHGTVDGVEIDVASGTVVPAADELATMSVIVP